MRGRVEWVKGWREGVKAVFEFMREMEKVENIDKLEEEYQLWEKADEVTKPKGEVIKRYE